MNDSKKSWLIGSISGFVIIALLFGAGYFFYSKFVKKSIGKQVDETKLYIGIPNESGDQKVDLVIDAKGPSGKFSKTFSSDELVKVDGQDESIRFYDYAAAPLIDFSGKTAGAWLADSANSIKVHTIALGLVNSGDVTIDKSGVWFINVASTDGQTPAVSHSYVFTNYTAGLEGN
jgi:hypothetical protein